MSKPRFLLSVTNDDNDFQIEQVKTARQAANKAGVDLEILHAGDNGILQSQQLLDKIQSPVDLRPNAIFLEPAGSTVLPQVARAAAAAGIGWALLSRNAEYLNELRSTYRVAAFLVTPDHEKIGHIQGRQLAALLPRGGLGSSPQFLRKRIDQRRPLFSAPSEYPADVSPPLECRSQY